MKIIISLLLVSAITSLNAQDLSGTWEGTYSSPPEYAKMVIVKAGNNYVGYTYDEGMGYCMANFIGQFDPAAYKLKGHGDGMIKSTITHSQSIFDLNYSKVGDYEYLRGQTWAKTLAVRLMEFGMSSKINLRRTSKAIDTTDYIRKHLAAINTEPEKDSLITSIPGLDKTEEKILSIKEDRKADTIQTISVQSKKINLKIFDNGISDGDSISVIYNDRVVATGITVTSKAIEISIELRP